MTIRDDVINEDDVINGDDVIEAADPDVPRGVVEGAPILAMAPGDGNVPGESGDVGEEFAHDDDSAEEDFLEQSHDICPSSVIVASPDRVETKPSDAPWTLDGENSQDQERTMVVEPTNGDDDEQEKDIMDHGLNDENDQTDGRFTHDDTGTDGVRWEHDDVINGDGRDDDVIDCDDGRDDVINDDGPHEDAVHDDPQEDVINADQDDVTNDGQDGVINDAEDDVINDGQDDVINDGQDDVINDDDQDEDIGNDSIEQVDATSDAFLPHNLNVDAKPDHDHDRQDVVVARAICFSDVSDDDDDDVAVLGGLDDDDDHDVVDEYAILFVPPCDTASVHLPVDKDQGQSTEFDAEFPPESTDLWDPDVLFLPPRMVDAELARLRRLWGDDTRGFWGAVLDASPVVILAAHFPFDQDSDDLMHSWQKEEQDGEVLTEADREAIAAYVRQWHAAHLALRVELTPPTPTPVPEDGRSGMDKLKTSRLLQRPSSFGMSASLTSLQAAVPTTPSFLRKPTSGSSGIKLPRTASTPPPTTALPTSSGGPGTPPTPARQMRLPTTRTTGLRTPSSRSIKQ
ncbi:hypothetical protein DYB26_007073 [Aphanomyces astaci]|uniref:Uncharacterized protein n=2 Tax=Aphanomyces astaci TaxID=112090 RepID=A0A3R7AXG6_APHAT|nr:hypothetical protein DYB26_007073 [Aphanomyces astaci]